MTTADELRAMLAKAQRYMESAEALRQRGDHDSAISRLYYTMFYCAEALLFAKGLSFSSHRAVISAFAQHLVKPGLLPTEMHRWLREAFEKRQISDYEFGVVAMDADVAEMSNQAAEFVRVTKERLREEGCL